MKGYSGAYLPIKVPWMCCKRVLRRSVKKMCDADRQIFFNFNMLAKGNKFKNSVIETIHSIETENRKEKTLQDVAKTRNVIANLRNMRAFS